MNSSTSPGPSTIDGSSAESTREVLGAEEHCVFECSGHVFAIALSAVCEVVSGKLATSIPQAPPVLIGVVELHGDALPIVQLATLLGTPARPYTPASQIVVLCSEDTRIGAVVDRVHPLRVIDYTSLTPTEHHLYRGWWREATTRIAVLNPAALVVQALETVAYHLQHACGGITLRTRRTNRPS